MCSSRPHSEYSNIEKCVARVRILNSNIEQCVNVHVSRSSLMYCTNICVISFIINTMFNEINQKKSTTSDNLHSCSLNPHADNRFLKKETNRNI